ncbi:MAG: hypothetical protein WBM57_17260, partial [Woeseiaceae bacterium]
SRIAVARSTKALALHMRRIRTRIFGVDLQRNLSQKWPFLASKTDPSAVSQIFEMAAIRFV